MIKIMLPFLCLFSLKAYSQSIEKIIANPDVIWAAEVYTNVDTERNYWAYSEKIRNIHQIKDINGHKFLKYTTGNATEGTNDQELIVKMLANIDRMDCYKEDKLLTQLTDEEVIKRLTYSALADSNSTKIQVPDSLTVRFCETDILCYRVKELIYYNKKDLMFYSLPLAVAPMLARFDENNEYSEIEPLFWLPINTTKKEPNLNRCADITWAKRVRRNHEVETAKVVKGTSSYEQTLEQMMVDIRAQSDFIYLEDPTYYHPLKPQEIAKLGTEKKTVANPTNFVLPAKLDTLTATDTASYLASDTAIMLSVQPDTATASDSSTLQVAVEVVVKEVVVPPVQFKKMNFIQDWIWNEKRGHLDIRLVAFSPIDDIYDENGNYAMSAPVFFKYTDKKRGGNAKKPKALVLAEQAEHRQAKKEVQARKIAANQATHQKNKALKASYKASRKAL